VLSATTASANDFWHKVWYTQGTLGSSTFTEGLYDTLLPLRVLLVKHLIIGWLLKPLLGIWEHPRINLIRELMTLISWLHPFFVIKTARHSRHMLGRAAAICGIQDLGHLIRDHLFGHPMWASQCVWISSGH